MFPVIDDGFAFVCLIVLHIENFMIHNVWERYRFILQEFTTSILSYYPLRIPRHHEKRLKLKLITIFCYNLTKVGMVTHAFGKLQYTTHYVVTFF